MLLPPELPASGGNMVQSGNLFARVWCVCGGAGGGKIRAVSFCWVSHGSLLWKQSSNLGPCRVRSHRPSLTRRPRRPSGSPPARRHRLQTGAESPYPLRFYMCSSGGILSDRVCLDIGPWYGYWCGVIGRPRVHGSPPKSAADAAVRPPIALKTRRRAAPSPTAFESRSPL